MKPCQLDTAIKTELGHINTMFYWLIYLKMNVEYKITLIHGQPILDCMVPYLYSTPVMWSQHMIRHQYKHIHSWRVEISALLGRRHQGARLLPKYRQKYKCFRFFFLQIRVSCCKMHAFIMFMYVDIYFYSKCTWPLCLAHSWAHPSMLYHNFYVIWSFILKSKSLKTNLAISWHIFQNNSKRMNFSFLYNNSWYCTAHAEMNKTSPPFSQWLI